MDCGLNALVDDAVNTTNCRAYYSIVLRPFSNVQACLKYLLNAGVMLSN